MDTEKLLKQIKEQHKATLRELSESGQLSVSELADMSTQMLEIEDLNEANVKKHIIKQTFIKRNLNRYPRRVR